MDKSENAKNRDGAESISKMAKSKNYSFIQLVYEGDKIDIACRSCHRIETLIQIEKGLINPNIRVSLEYDDYDEEKEVDEE